MIVRILGSAAGGGYPQWNCNCRVCAAARNGNGHAASRTQSSIAVRSDNGPWFLINASPDLRQQIADLPGDRTDKLRINPFAGIVLTDAEIDHTAGLLLMRESHVPLQIYSSEAVRQALIGNYPVLTMLDHYCGVQWSRLDPGDKIVLGDSLEVEAFATGGDPPLYLEGDAHGITSMGLTIRDRETGGTLSYAPALELLDDAMIARFSASDYVAVDGTFWTADELPALGLAERDAHAMGHMPLSGPDGSLAVLKSLPAHTILLHINNTNPILLDDSAEHAAVQASGVGIARDGMEIQL